MEEESETSKTEKNEVSKTPEKRRTATIIALLVAVIFALAVAAMLVVVNGFLPLFIGLGETAYKVSNVLLYVVTPITAVLTGIVTFLLVFPGIRAAHEK